MMDREAFVAMRRILETLAAWDDEDYSHCPLCGGVEDLESDPIVFLHLESCPVILARRLLTKLAPDGAIQ